jgi:hypothetical protein
MQAETPSAKALTYGNILKGVVLRLLASLGMA